MKKILLLPILIIFLSFIVASDTEYNFLTATTLSTQATNNTYLFQGNINNSYFLYGNINGTIKKVNVNNLSDVTILTNATFYSNTAYACKNLLFINPSSSGGFFYLFKDNTSICYSGALGTAYYYNSTGAQVTTTSHTANQWIGYTYSGTNVTYEYSNSGNPNLFAKFIMPARTQYPALNCYSQLSTVFSNNFGINLTAKGGLNQSYASGTMIQHNLSLFYFQVDNRWFYFEESNSNDCTEIAQTLQEATLTFPEVTTTNNRYIIINDELYITSKDGTTINLIGSEEVDIYSDLVCNDDYSLCYNQSGVCFPNNDLYPGINSSNYLCTNVSMINDGLYCDLAGLVYYAGGCLNTGLTNYYNVSYTTGTGYNSTECDNDCDIEGLTYSDNITSYKQCGFYDSDACLDWSYSFPCGDGKYSLNGFCYTLNTTGNIYYSLRSFTATPNLGISSSYDLNTNPKKVSYTFTGILGHVGIDYTATPTSFYINKICDYTTTNILNDLSTNTVNTTKTYLVPTYTNGESTFRFNLPVNGSVLITGTDATDLPIYIYNISLNETYGVCLYSNVTLLGCETSSSINFVEFTVKTARPNDKQLHSAKLLINGAGGQDIYTGFFVPLSNPVNSLGKIVITSSNVNVTYANVFNEAQINTPWKNTTWTIISNGEIFYQHNCDYTSNGCRTMRSFYQDDLGEGYWNTQDWAICIGLNGQSVEVPGSSLFGNLTKSQKLIYGFILSGIIVLFFVILGVMQHDEREQKILTWIGVFGFIGGIIIFSILGWIPVWILIVCGILASISMGLFFISKMNGA